GTDSPSLSFRFCYAHCERGHDPKGIEPLHESGVSTNHIGLLVPCHAKGGRLGKNNRVGCIDQRDVDLPDTREVYVLAYLPSWEKATGNGTSWIQEAELD